MSHPFKSHSQSSRASKHRAMGLARGGRAHDDAVQDAKMIKTAMDKHDKQLHGGKHTDLGFARGGRAKAGKVNVNIIVPQNEKPAPSPGPLDLPAAAPGPLPSGPVGGGPIPPRLPPGGLPPGGPSPGGPPPMIRKSGGRVPEKLAKYGKLPDAGGGTGEGRLQKARLFKKDI